MTIELPQQIESTLNEHATARGVSPAIYVLEMLEQKFKASPPPQKSFKNSYGLLANYGTAPNADEIDENRTDMFRNSIFARDVE